MFMKIFFRKKFYALCLLIIIGLYFRSFKHSSIETNFDLSLSSTQNESLENNFERVLNESIKEYEECKIPELDYGGKVDNEPPKECKNKMNWGHFDFMTHKWSLSEIKNDFKRIECTYQKIERVDDFKINIGPEINLEDGQQILDDVFEVFCKGIEKISNKKDLPYRFNNLYAQIIDKSDDYKNQTNQYKTDNNNCTPLNIMLLSYDSVSKVSWFNRLPKTYKFLKDEMKFFILNSYNILGDGTPAALIPIYTGFTEEELPSGLKNDPKGRYVDEIYPFIWKDLHEKNYVSIYLDDWPHVGAFTYRMRGFFNHTAKHYFKHYQLRLWQKVSKFYLSKNAKLDDFCIGNTKRHKVVMNLLTDFKKIYNKKMLNIALMHYIENSHDTNSRLNWIDDDLRDFLSNGFKEGLFENTAIFLYSDHGARFNDKRSKQRYFEERLPFFSIFLPDNYQLKYPEKIKNLKENINRLTSPFDIYSTVCDLTCLDNKQQTSTNETSFNDRKRSISLLDKISIYRSCNDIGIPEHYCTCIKPWQVENSQSLVILGAVQFAISSINALTNFVRRLCAKLYLKEIISSEKLIKSTGNLYKVEFITLPNKGIYETLVYEGQWKNFEFKSKDFSIKSRNDISRIDGYGTQPRCVSNFGSNPGLILDLRKFCYCGRSSIFG